MITSPCSQLCGALVQIRDGLGGYGRTGSAGSELKACLLSLLRHFNILICKHIRSWPKDRWTSTSRFDHGAWRPTASFWDSRAVSSGAGTSGDWVSTHAFINQFSDIDLTILPSIVAVHGLNGDAVKTWTSESGNICWLNHPDLLPTAWNTLSFVEMRRLWLDEGKLSIAVL
jgi:hypothetical protein